VKVVDASALIDVLTGTARSKKLLPHLDDDLFAPDMLIPEVFSYLKRMTTARRLTEPQAEELSLAFRRAPIEYLHTWPYAERIWKWRHNLSPYDAAYVALANDLGAPLLTTDNRLARAAAGVVTIIAI
jgi:predicted nucleic acid-binding protein